MLIYTHNKSPVAHQDNNTFVASRPWRLSQPSEEEIYSRRRKLKARGRPRSHNSLR